MARIPFDNVTQQYLADLRLQNFSGRTVDMYGDVLRFFRKYAANGEAEGMLSLASITAEVTRGYIAARMGQTTLFAEHPLRPTTPGQLSMYTVDREVRVLKAFGNWMQANGYSNPFANLKRPKLPRHLITILSVDEITRLNVAYNPETHAGVRWQAILAFFLDTGVRLSELTELTIANLDLAKFRAKVCGKGDKERYVRFGARTHRLLTKYLHVFRPKSDCPHFFLDLRGNPLTANNLTHIVHKTRRKADVPRAHCHLFRHTFATNFLLQGGNVFELQEPCVAMMVWTPPPII